MIFKGKGKKEDVIKRKSYYGFCVNYPGDLGSNKYVIGESRAARNYKKNSYSRGSYSCFFGGFHHNRNMP